MSNEAESPSYFGRNWPMFLMLVSGIVLVGVAAWVAQKNDLMRRLTLDVKGVRGMATAEPRGADTYWLRLAMDTVIYSRMYKGKLSAADPNSNEPFSLPVSYDPADPKGFLPAGQSYVPAIVSGLLFLAGMTCALLARRAAFAASRYQEMSRQRAELERQRKKQRHKHRHQQHRGEHAHH
ncbi:MAG: hypothetical protein IT367_00775 [Candidatus Hydrogenedentes bacterium]|nr:hypothetical protein [Candidatus Hydrogenedentota bacterium]